MKTGQSNAEVEQLLALLDEAYEKKAWHGANFKGSIRGLLPKQALWRPAPARHNIWEIVVHAAYWKYTVRRRLLSEKKGSFPLKGSNWFPRGDGLNLADWRHDLALLEETHLTMREAIARLTSKELRLAPEGSKVSNATLIRGIASHDLYHAGQIQLLKRLQK